MNRENRFPNQADTMLDRKIKDTLSREFPLPENVENARMQAFARIREREAEKRKDEVIDMSAKKTSHRSLFKACAGVAAAAAVFSGVCVVNPAFASKIPVVGHVFEELGDFLGFSGNYHEVATVLEECSAVAAEGTAAESTYSKTSNGLNVTLSEVYSNDMALYLSVVLKAENGFPEDMMRGQDGEPIVTLMASGSKVSFNDNVTFTDHEVLDGKMIDENTYAGVLRYDLSDATDTTDYNLYYQKYMEYLKSIGISEEEYDSDFTGTMKRVAEHLNLDPDEMTELDVRKAGNLEQYITTGEIPESFTLNLHLNGIYGYKENPETPDMPAEIRTEYEKKMADAGLSTKEEDYASFTEEQKEQERVFFNEMYQAYSEKYPETDEVPNKYENWVMEGSWDYTVEVTSDSSRTVVKAINDVDENGLGLVSVKKSPFEIEVEDGKGADYFTVILDANGDLMDESGKQGGSTNTVAVGNHDVSKIFIYICDYDKYMDELKGYYWSEDYEQKKAVKSFQQLLEENALYRKEIVFE